jgi:Na+/H+-dicarboxylate symporter
MEGNLQMKFFIGLVLGIVLTAFYPDIIPSVKNAFVESGIRDATVQTLMEVK